MVRLNKAKSMIFLVQWVIIVSLFMCLPFAQAQVGTVILGAGNGFGEPGSTDNPVEVMLDNQDDRTTGVQFDVCRGDDLTLSACESTVRTSGISCTPNDLGNGCDRILFFSFGGDFIEAGTGPILTLTYDVAPEAPQGACQDLTLAHVLITECIDDGEGGCTTGPKFENVNLENGEFCFGDATTTTVPSTTTTVPSTTTAGVDITPKDMISAMSVTFSNSILTPASLAA